MSKYNISDVVRQDVEAMLMMTYTSIPAIVISHNTEKQTLKVRVATDSPTYTGENIPAVVLEDVPVIFPSGSDWVIAGKLAPNDTVLLVTPHYGIEEYLQGDKGKVGSPLSVRRHDLNEAVAIPGLFQFRSPTRKPELKDTFHIAQGTTNSITLDESGGVTVTSGSNTISISDSGIEIVGNVTVTGNLVVDNGVTTVDLNTHTHPYTDTPVGPSNTLIPTGV